jgi:hypothetical protein
MSKLANFEHEFLQSSTDPKRVVDEFLKPINTNIFHLNKRGMIRDSTTIFTKFEKSSWDRNPQQFSFDIYGDKEYYLVVMLVNNISSQFKFIKDNFYETNIITPSLNTIIKTLSLEI